MGKFNNMPGENAPKASTKNKFEAEDMKSKGSKIKSYDASKATPSKKIVADTNPRNIVDKDITSVKKPVMGANDVEGTNRVTAPVSKKTASPAVTKTAAPVSKKTASPVAKSRFERMRDAYASFGGSGDTAENQAIQKRLSSGMANYKSGGAVKASRGDGIAQRGKTRGKMC